MSCVWLESLKNIILDPNNIELLKIKMGNCEVSLAERYTNTFSYYSITDKSKF